MQNCRVVIHSVGTASAGVVAALRKALPFSEERLAACIYQAPAELIGQLDRATAEALVEAIASMGLEAEVLDSGQDFTRGRAEYDVALAFYNADRLLEVVREVINFLGVNFAQARQILCACPTELMGKISANTVDVIRRRFEPLGVEVDVSLREEALFDLFMGNCTTLQRAQAKRGLIEAGLEAEAFADVLEDTPHVLLCGGLRADEARACVERLKISGAPTRIVNRDFQRFDVRLEEAPDSQAMVEFLMATAGMPAAIAAKVPKRTPIVIRHNLRYSQTQEVLSRIAELGGRATAHLLALRSVRLHLDKVGDADSTARLLEMLVGIHQDRARQVARALGPVDHPTTVPQARWIQHELRRVGTDARMVMV